MPVLGVDIGGSKIAAGCVNERAEVTASELLPTRAAEGFDVSYPQLEEVIRRVLTPDIRAIGICAPGPLNPKTGVVINPPNLPGWRDVPLTARIQERFGLPCRLDNDANAAGLAEYLFGAARGCSGVFYITFSTGIGTGLVLDGKIYYGKNGFAAEGGHVTVDYSSPVTCNCGLRGCIEALAAGPAIAARAHRLLPEYPDTLLRPPVTTEAIGQAVHAGDPLALRVLDETADVFSAWLGSMISLLDPDIVVIGGGVTEIGEPLFARLRDLTPKRTINPFAARTPIVRAALRRDVGILGAAAVVMGL